MQYLIKLGGVGPGRDPRATAELAALAVTGVGVLAAFGDDTLV